MSKGSKQLTKGQRFELLEKKVQQLEMSMRVNQMMLQQMGGSLPAMQSDLTETITRQRELQYRVLAAQELAGLSVEQLDAKSTELQIRDFNEASDKEDAEKEYTVADVVAENSAVIVTSKTPDEEEDKGVLRSKLVVSEIALPDLAEGLIGTKVGDKVETNLNGTRHVVEVLGIRTVPAVQQEQEETVEFNTDLAAVQQGNTSGEETTANG